MVNFLSQQLTKISSGLFPGVYVRDLTAFPLLEKADRT
jgi:hypothetical protein